MSDDTAKNILAICGSTRQHSSNHQLIKCIASIFSEQVQINLLHNISTLPHYNPDDDKEKAPEAVTHFRNLVLQSDGILICTPEYAHGVPGSLKNAIDWLVSSSSFSGKPTVLITASTDGKFGHAALLETLKVIEAKQVEQLQLRIPFIQTKIHNNIISDEKTLQEIKALMAKFIDIMQ